MKRLTAPPAATEYNQPGQDVPGAPRLIEKSSDKVQDHHNDERNTASSHDGAQLEVNSHSYGTSEFGELLKEKTFTRAEFEQLRELLQSRVVESSQSGPDNCLEQIRKLNVPELTNKQSERVQLPNEGDVEGDISEHRTNESLELHGYLTPTDGNVVHEDSAASPSEIAKSYMGSRSSKAFPATRGIRNLTFQENRQLSNELSHGKKHLDFPLVPSPAITGTPKVPATRGIRNLTFQDNRRLSNELSHGKKHLDFPLVPSRAITGTPKVSDIGHPTPRIHGRSAMHRMSRSPFFKLQTSAPYRGGRDIDAGPLTKYELTPTNMVQSENKKAVKRRISDLDDGVASSGHLRRIRQKYQVTAPSSKLSSSHTLSSWDQHGKDARIVAGSGEKLLYLEEHKYAGNESTFPSSVIPVPLQSSEMARKIFQQLDKLMPSPKEKSSAYRNESPSKLTNNMLHGRALKSMQNIDLPNFLEAHEVGNSGAGAIQESLPGLFTDTQNKGEENGFPEKHIKGVKVASETSVKAKSAIIVSDDKCIEKDPQFAAFVGTAAITNKPAFRMSAHEEFFDSDDENNELEDSSNLDVRRDDKLELISELPPVNGEITGPEKHIEPLSKPMPMPSTGSERDIDKKVTDRPLAQNNNGFKLATTSGSVSSVETCSLPPVSSVPFKSSDLPKEKVTDDTSLSTITPLGNSATIKFDERVTWPSKATLAEDKVSEKSSYVNGEGLFTTFGGASSGLSTSTSPVLSISPDLPTFSLSRDIPPVTPNISVSVPTATNSNNSVASATNSSAAATCSTGPSISKAASTFSTNSLFRFDSSSSLVASKPLVLTADKSDANAQGTGSTASASPGINDAVTPITSMAPLSSASNNSALSSMFSSISSTSSIPASSLFSGISNSGSALSTSALSNSNNSLFAFGAPSSAGLTSSFSPNNSPQSLGALFQSNSSTIVIPETQPANGVALPSQGSSCQYGSFASTPVFGLTGSSSSSSVSSLSTFAADPKPLGTSTGLSFLKASSASSGSVGNTSFAPATTFGSSGFLSAGAFSSSTCGSGSSFVSGTPFSSTSVFSSAAGAASSSTSSNSSSVVPSASTSLFTSSASTASSSLFGSTISSTTSSPTGFSFGSAAPSSGSSPFTFGASSGSVYSFNSAGNTNSSISPAQPTFGVPNQFANHASGSPGNDQMNMEDSMADDPVQPSTPTVSAFGQPTNAPTNPNFVFGSPAVPSSTSTFQFGNQQNFSVPQNPSLFQNSGNLEFSGGSFSLGSSADKAGRRIVRAKRDKHRKK